jgi:hypothetical protein
MRKNGENEVLVLLNLSRFPIEVHVNDKRIEGIFTEVFTGKENSFFNNRDFQMNPWSYLVWKK